MLWSEVRELYPSQFVYLEDLQSHIEDGKLYVDEVAIIRPLIDSHEALQALKAAKANKFIYHTSNEKIVMDVVMKPMVRGIRS
ncbi:hypothetical protein [Alicyclobacillus sp. SP_1]|jgi:hypothetical protein|uniref:hypothetical protein n=1 Tax=Alicyclobacillus sp. SP_1 TaxID=2942475 RepID=UPI002156F938|nr:hypothetical protein [Alicyclobacillus sp. SP_1]